MGHNSSLWPQELIDALNPKITTSPGTTALSGTTTLLHNSNNLIFNSYEPFNDPTPGTTGQWTIQNPNTHYPIIDGTSTENIVWKQDAQGNGSWVKQSKLQAQDEYKTYMMEQEFKLIMGQEFYEKMMQEKKQKLEDMARIEKEKIAAFEFEKFTRIKNWKNDVVEDKTLTKIADVIHDLMGDDEIVEPAMTQEEELAMTMAFLENSCS